MLAACIGWVISPTLGIADDHVVWGCEDAGYTSETTEYPHGVLGDTIEYKTLVMHVPTGVGKLEASLELPEGQVFEDIAPRCGDLDGDGEPEVVTIISDSTGGARLALFSPLKGPIAETPPIGRANRWLAPVGIADMDGDGQNDVAYVEKPHIGGTLRVWTLRDGELVELANANGFSNHRIGEDFITGGVRDCGQGAELVLPNFNWRTLMAVKMRDGGLWAKAIAEKTDPETVAAALACKQ